MAGNRNRFLLRNAKLPANSTCSRSSSSAGHQRHEEQKREQDRRLAEDVFGPHQRLRQINLQRIGAAIVGDQASAHVDGDDEDEEILLLEKLPERFRGRRKHRHLWIVRGHIDLHGADEKREPREEQQAEERCACGARSYIPARAITIHACPGIAFPPRYRR